MAEKFNNSSKKDTAKDFASEEEKKGLMMASSDRHNNTGSFAPGSVSMNEVIEMIVFLRDRTGIHFNLEDGHLAQADDLLDLVIDEKNLPDIAKQAFALWIVSDLLDLRMKRSHHPYHVVEKWDELCVIYTGAEFEDIVKSEPVLMVQRDVFFTLGQERNITNEQMLCLLYHEAKFNVIEGRYVLFPEDYNRLAGLQALIHLGKYDPKEHVPARYRSSIIQFYPEHMYQKQKFLFFTTSKNNEGVECEDLMRGAHQELSNEFADLDIPNNLSLLYQKYLDVCRSYPMYGSAFFHGQIERPVNRFKRMMNIGTSVKCLIAINTDCVTLIDKENHVVVLTVPFTQLSWRYKEAEFDVDDETLDCLYLQFLYDCPQQGQVTKLLEVYSKEAKLMDALISSCVKRKLDLGVEPEDFVDSRVTSDSDNNPKVIHKMDKLCCATYTVQGNRID
ncbi:hypothetical protein SNE40_009848 [Patella caerulea]|uniref:FERM domain-containing protein 8 n=1 Tax=Patella caerulea TaxID=87958 RepID=A0AAN8PSZ1_PATCE